MEQLVDILTNFGFPIAVCAYLFFERAQERKEHREETKAITEALNNNTIVLEKILTTLGVDHNANVQQ